MFPLRNGNVVMVLACLLAMTTTHGSSRANDTLPDEKPPVFYSNLPETARTAPIWVSAEQAAEGVGTNELRWDLFSSTDTDRLRSTLPYLRLETGQERRGVVPIEEEDCIVQLARHWPRSVAPPHDGLLDLLLGAKAVFSGTITAITPGFLFGAPVSMLTVSLDDKSVIAEAYTPSPRIYVPYPQARFAIGGLAFCTPEQEAQPEVGYRIFVFPQFGPADREGLVVTGGTEVIVFADEEGHLLLPENLQRDGEMTGTVSYSELERKIGLGLPLVGMEGEDHADN